MYNSFNTLVEANTNYVLINKSIWQNLYTRININIVTRLRALSFYL